MKKSILILFMALGFNAVNAQITNPSTTNGVPDAGTAQQATSFGIQQSPAQNFNTTPYIQTAPIPTPVAPNVQTTIPGAETQPGDNTQYPSGSNNSSNANSNGAMLNNGMPIPPNKE